MSHKYKYLQMGLSISWTCAAFGISFGELRTCDKDMICSQLVECAKNTDVSCGVFVPSEMDKELGAWSLTYAPTAFTRMKSFSLHPTFFLWGFPADWKKEHVRQARRDPIYLYLNEECPEDLLGHRCEDLASGRYAPFVAADEQPVFAFVRSQRRPLYPGRKSFLMEGELNAGELVDSMCSNLWASSVFAVVSNCAFHIASFSGCTAGDVALPLARKKRMDERRKVSKCLAATAPLISLGKREVSEIVYVVALCRGVVSSMDEFNEAIVKRNDLGFMVELTVEDCETEFGRGLYQKAKKDRLLPGKRTRQ